MDSLATLQPRIEVTKIGDRIVGAYLLFRKDIVAHTTRRFTRSDGARLNIDVDRANVPIGMEVIDLDAAEPTSEPISCPPIEQMVVELFAFCARMAALVQENRNEESLLKLGDSILREIVLTLPYAQHGSQLCKK